MMLVELSEIPTMDLPIAACREYLRVATGFGDDVLQDGVLETCLRAALAAIEARTGKVLYLRDFRWTLTAWRNLTEQALPVAPVASLTGIKTLTRSGSETIVDLDRVRLIQDLQRPMIRATGSALPAIPTGGTVEVTFSAGFGTAWTDLPVDLMQAILLLATHYYELRHDQGQSGGGMPLGVSMLIERYRTLRILGGREG